MESHSDKSSSLSADSGGLIDLYALDSDCKIGDSSQASLDKSKEVNRNLFDKRRRQPSGEAWQLDIDTRMKDMKLIEEEEFDFDIPDDYLNISMEPEQPSSTEEDSLSSPDLQGTKWLLVDVEEGNVVTHEVQGREKRGNKRQQCFMKVGNLAPLCAGPGEACIHGEAGNDGLADTGISQVPTFEEVSQNGSVGVVELLPMGCCDTTRVLSSSKCDLIAFTPAPEDCENLQEGFDCVSALQYNPGEDCCNVMQTYVCQKQLGRPEVSGEEQLESLDVPGQIVEQHPEISEQIAGEQVGQAEVYGDEQLEVSGQMVLGQPGALGQIEEGQCLSSSKSQELEGKCEGDSSVGELQRRSSDSVVPLNRSKLPTPSNQLKRCSTFSRSPVKCIHLEELREASKQLTHHPLPQPCPSETFIFQTADVTTALSSLPSDQSAIQQSSSCETVVVSISSSGSSPTAEVGRENLDDSRSSCLSQASQVSNASSTTSRSSRESSLGGGVSKLPRKPGRVRGIPRASSQSKLSKPGSSKPSLLPSKPVTSMSTGTRKLPEKPLAKPTVTRDAQGSHSNLRLKLPSAGGAGGSASSVSGGGDGVQAGATNSTMIPRKPSNTDKGSRLTYPMRATGLMKPAASAGKIPTYNSNKLLNSRATQQHHVAGTSAGRSTAGGTTGPKSKLSSPAPRRWNSTSAAASNANSRPATAMTQDKHISAVPATSTLSTSIVSTGSPCVQQSTPVKETPGQKLVDRTPKRNLIRSTPDRVRPRFSLSSIESITPNPPPTSPCPHTNETYSIGGGEGGTKTPKSSKKRRSLIPTPGGQERVCSRRVGSPVPFSFGGECTFSVAAGEQEPQLVNGSSPLKNKESGAEDRSKRLTNMPPPKTKRLLKPGMRPSGLQRPVQKMGTRVLGVRPNGGTLTREPMKAKTTYAFGGYDEEDSEIPTPRTRVVHSPLDKENRLATPHSKWSPIRKRRLTADEECIQCTKRTTVRHN